MIDDFGAVDGPARRGRQCAALLQGRGFAQVGPNDKVIPGTINLLRCHLRSQAWPRVSRPGRS